MAINISTSSGFFRWRPACWLRVTGDDAATFLQGQFTNDLRALPAAPAVYGLWLSLKGKVLADSFVLRGPGDGEFWIGSYFSAADVVRARLESHVIADDVTIEDETAGWAGVTVLGADAEALRAAAGGAKGFAFPGRRDRAANAEWVHRIADGEPAWAGDAAARELTADDITRLRITAGLPAIPADVGPADLPNEAGLEADALSYTKGCYLGQEVMARLKSMGQVRRRLLRVRGDGAPPAVRPAGVFAGARQVGELRSAVADARGGWIGLAMLSLLHLTPGGRLSFASDGPPALDLVDSP